MNIRYIIPFLTIGMSIAFVRQLINGCIKMLSKFLPLFTSVPDLPRL